MSLDFEAVCGIAEEGCITFCQTNSETGKRKRLLGGRDETDVEETV